MSRKLQVVFDEEAWRTLERALKDANDNFKHGSINYSDVVNEAILVAKIDFRLLQAKHTNIRKSLRILASDKEIDLDSAIEALMDLKAKGAKRKVKLGAQMDLIDGE